MTILFQQNGNTTISIKPKHKAVTLLKSDDSGIFLLKPISFYNWFLKCFKNLGHFLLLFFFLFWRLIPWLQFRPAVFGSCCCSSLTTRVKIFFPKNLLTLLLLSATSFLYLCTDPFLIQMSFPYQSNLFLILPAGSDYSTSLNFQYLTFSLFYDT